MLFHVVGARHASPGAAPAQEQAAISWYPPLWGGTPARAAPAQETGCRFVVPAIVGEGTAGPARTYSLYKPPSKWQTLPTCHCEEATRPTWQSRGGTCSSYRAGDKTCKPIASVAALTAQPLRVGNDCGTNLYGSTAPNRLCSAEEANGRRGNRRPRPDGRALQAKT